MSQRMKIELPLATPMMLCVVFIVLKLAKVVDWDWVWVLCPMWIPVALLMVIMLIGACLTMVIAMMDIISIHRSKRW